MQTRSRVLVAALLLFCAVAIADNSQEEPNNKEAEHSEHKLVEEAKDASVANDKGVTNDANGHNRQSLKKEDRLRGLISSMKGAAAGVAQRAATDAAKEISQPFVKSYSKSIHARMAAEKSAAAAKQHLDKAQAERLKQNQAVIAALVAERAAAVAATEKSEEEAHHLENKLAKLHATEEAVRGAATKKAKNAFESQIRAASQTKVATYTAKANAAEREAAAAKAALDEAFKVKAKADALKAKALKLKNQRAQLTKGTKSSTVSAEFIEDGAAPHARFQQAHNEPNAVSHRTMAHMSVMFLIVGVFSLGIVLAKTSPYK